METGERSEKAGAFPQPISARAKNALTDYFLNFLRTRRAAVEVPLIVAVQ